MRKFYLEYWATLLLFVALFIFYSSSLSAIFQYSNINLNSLFSPYLLQILKFSLWQAFLSASISIFCGILLARALFHTHFKFKRLLTKIINISIVLPTLVAVFGFIDLYGKTGFIAQIASFFGFDYQFNLYGLKGILMVHCFFNIPLACKIFMQNLATISENEQKLVAVLGLNSFKYFIIVEWNYLRKNIGSVFSLIFMLCFISFSIVLTMGGSPKFSTLEVAIYQAIIFEFNLAKAAILALLQFIICVIIFISSNRLNSNNHALILSQQQIKLNFSSYFTAVNIVIIIVFSIFILSPILSTLITGFSQLNLSYFQQKDLYQALFFSLSIGFASACLSILISFFILLGARRLRQQNHLKLYKLSINLTMSVLAIPTLVLSLGIFLLLENYQLKTWHLFLIVVFTNSLIAQPFMLQILAQPLQNNLQYFDKLCLSLDLKYYSRWRLIELPFLRPILSYALVFAFALSLGDFTVIALFGNQDFSSLPMLLYQQIGSYRSNDAAITALLLLLIYALLFLALKPLQEKSYVRNKKSEI